MKMLHEGKDGKVPSMRVMCMMSLVSAFALKAVQKFAEKDL